jgi:hypothetical protein
MSPLTWIDVASDAVKVLAGGAIGAGTAFLVEVYRRKQDRLKEREQRGREDLEKPVLAFADELLGLMSRAYWNKTDEKDPGTTELLEAFRAKEAMVQARPTAIRDSALSEALAALDSSYFSFRQALADNSLVKARDELKNAHKHGAAIFQAVHGMRE